MLDEIEFDIKVEPAPDAIRDGRILRYISLGAGVQSTVMSLMAARGEFGEMPDCAIFADTQSEPAAVYRLVEWLTEVLPFPVHTVTAGSILDAIAKPSIGGFVPVPTRRYESAGTVGMGRRQCTREYKIEPIEQEVRSLIGLRPRQHWPKQQVAECWLGISVDEIQRARTNPRDPTVTNRYPLLELGWRRADLLYWYERFRQLDWPPLARSACVCCPYRSTTEWLSLTDDEVEQAAHAEDQLNADADAVNDKLDGPSLRKQYLHRRVIPLREAVALDRAAADAQGALFGPTETEARDAEPCDSGHCFL